MENARQIAQDRRNAQRPGMTRPTSPGSQTREEMASVAEEVKKLGKVFEGLKDAFNVEIKVDNKVLGRVAAKGVNTNYNYGGL